MMEAIPHKKIEIFCGTGGVGKTTLATSRALALAKKDLKVLLITIDPAKRLKQILGMDNAQAGEVCTIPCDRFPGFEGQNSFDALLMSPRVTLMRMGTSHVQTKELENPILQILTRPNSGMNEIMAILEVQYHLGTNVYDCIILDTPPGKHFLDFLEGSRKIKKFFDKSFVEIFKYLGKSFGAATAATSAPTRIMGRLVSSGVKKLLSYLEKVTGADFVDTFVDAIIVLYKNKDHFLKALKFQESLAQQSFSNWFLVTSVEQQKISEAGNLQKRASNIMHNDNYLAINKSLKQELSLWHPNHPILEDLKASMLEREGSLDRYAAETFEKVLHFSEVSSSAPEAHVGELAQSWP